MAFDAFMKIDGIQGESTDDHYRDWIEISSWAQGCRQAASATACSAGGATSGRVEHEELHIVHFCDKATPKLLEACCTGKHLKSVQIIICRAGGERQPYATITLEQVIVSHIDMSGAQGVFPTETVSFNYGKIKLAYHQQNRQTGRNIGQVATGWDLTANKLIA